jgi:hypothetical protein
MILLVKFWWSPVGVAALNQEYVFTKLYRQSCGLTVAESDTGDGSGGPDGMGCQHVIA